MCPRFDSPEPQFVSNAPLAQKIQLMTLTWFTHLENFDAKPSKKVLQLFPNPCTAKHIDARSTSTHNARNNSDRESVEPSCLKSQAAPPLAENLSSTPESVFARRKAAPCAA